jgi:uncharacterized protein YjcR
MTNIITVGTIKKNLNIDKLIIIKKNMIIEKKGKLSKKETVIEVEKVEEKEVVIIKIKDITIPNLTRNLIIGLKVNDIYCFYHLIFYSF